MIGCDRMIEYLLLESTKVMQQLTHENFSKRALCSHNHHDHMRFRQESLTLNSSNVLGQ